MKRRLLLGLAVVGLATGFAMPAKAGVVIGLSFGLPVPPVVAPPYIRMTPPYIRMAPPPYYNGYYGNGYYPAYGYGGYAYGPSIVVVPSHGGHHHGHPYGHYGYAHGYGHHRH